MQAANNRDATSLWYVVQSIQGIQADVEGLSLELFLKDDKIQRAVERGFEILGEAARRISPEFQQAHPEIDWRNAINLRNIIAHRYETVSYERLWQIIQDYLPGLLLQLEPLLPPLP